MWIWIFWSVVHEASLSLSVFQERFLVYYISKRPTQCCLIDPVNCVHGQASTPRGRARDNRMLLQRDYRNHVFLICSEFSTLFFDLVIEIGDFEFDKAFYGQISGKSSIINENCYYVEPWRRALSQVWKTSKNFAGIFQDIARSLPVAILAQAPCASFCT